MTNKTLTNLTIIVLIIAIIMILALTASIVLVFAFGKLTFNKSIENQSTKISLPEPCECGCPVVSPQITSRIINGEAATVNSWPWHLLLVRYNYQGIPRSYCGASLITPKHILTAAHCVFGYSPRYIGIIPRVYVYNASRWSKELAYMAERIYVHESYDNITLNDDVAVIRLRIPIPLDDYVSPICLAPADMTSQKLIPGEQLVATGWGVIENVNRTTPNVLQQVRLQFVSQLDPLCEPLVGYGESIRLGQMCAGFPPKSVCFGDSGGPLVRSIVHSNGKTYWQQVGIMSWTVDCGLETKYPDVYAHVSYYNPWIIDKIDASP